MPVIDAFKNLIRHGKHARDGPSSSSSIDVGPTPVNTSSNFHAPSQQQQQTATEKYTAQANKAANAVSPGYQKEAQMIVDEEQRERERREKELPKYQGLESWTLLEKMGDGAFSNVYKAKDRLNGQQVAVKVVRKYEMSSSQSDGNKHLNPNFKKRPRVTERANILKEVQIMRGTDHPSIVKLISFSESPEHYFLVLELMPGGELFHQIVKLTYFSEQLSRHVILQVAHGIRYLHEERGVVHRDIKPENILFERIPIIPSRHPVHRQYDEDKVDEGEFQVGIGGGGIGQVKIADFGLSKVVWQEDTSTPCGTVGYTAPEIVKDERYSKSVDMWALGCVLYTLLCGFPPFYDESIAVLTEKVARGYYTFLSPWWDDISASSKDLISHLLCIDPNQRYTIDEFLAHPWCNEQAPPAVLQQHKPQSSLAPPKQDVPMDSPLLQSVKAANREGRSPGLATLKEAFDVTYAVHRMEEEGARRRAYNGPGGAGPRGFLKGLNEDDEEDFDEEDEPQHDDHANRVAQHLADQKAQRSSQPQQAAAAAAPQQKFVGSGGADRKLAEAALYDGRAGQRDRGRGTGREKARHGGFELDLNSATLLGRRKNVGSPLKLNLAASPMEVPGSPMRVN